MPTLALTQIRRENDLQARDQSHWTKDGAERTALDPAHVAALVEVLRSGRTFSTRPIVYQDDDTYWLADGWHRLAAYEVVGQTEIEVEIREGGRRGAFRHALGANAEHGKPRTQKDKRRAVDLALGDAEIGKLSNREIGDITGTSHTFVAGRRELLAAGEAMRQAAPRSRALGLAKARAALVSALRYAEEAGVETFDLPNAPGQVVALWYDGIDELSRDEIDEAIQALGDAHRAKTVPLYRQPPPRPDPLPGQQLLTGGEVPAAAPASERRAESRALGARIGRCIAALRLMDPHDLVHLGGDVGLVEAGILLGSATSAPWAEIELATLEAALFPAINPDGDDGPGSLVALESTCPDPSPPAASPASPSAEKALEALPATADDCADSATAGAGPTCNGAGPTSPPSASPAASGDAATTCPTSAAAASSSSTTKSPEETTSTTAATNATTATTMEPSKTGIAPAGMTSPALMATIEPDEDGRSAEDTMVAEALDRWRSTVCLALGLPEMGRLEQVAEALALLKVQANGVPPEAQHRLDAAVDRERQALARAERAEREAAQLRIRADQVAALEADLVKAHERAEALAAQLRQAQEEHRWAIEAGRTAAGEAAKWGQERVEALQADLQRALARLEEYGRAVGEARAQLDAVPAGWPEGWKRDDDRDDDDDEPSWVGPLHRISIRAYRPSRSGVAPRWEVDVDVDAMGASGSPAAAVERARQVAWGLAGRPLPEPALTAEEAARVLAESAARMSQIRARRDDWDEPATLPPDPLAIYRPWKGGADELAAQLNALEPADLERVRLGFTVASGARLVERLTVAIRRGGR